MKKIKYILFILIAFAFNACNNDSFFELQRPPQFPWNTVSELEFAAVSPYNAFFYGGWSAPQSNQLLNQVIQSDYFRFLGNVEGYATEQLYKRKYTDRIADVEALYTNMYKVIGLANNGLEFYRKTNNDPFPYASVADKTNNINRIKGELLFMRAYAYYQLVITFCPAYGYGANNDTKILVKRDHVSYSSEDALNNAPATTGEIYDMIVSDLKEAKTLLPVDWADGMHISYKNRARANKWAASAFLAQVYFTMQKFAGTESAITELDDVIANGGYSLTPDPFTCFENSSTSILKSENSEVIMWQFFADSKMFTTIHNSLRLTHFNKCARDAKNGGNGNTSSGTSPKWSNFHTWLQLTLAKNSLIEMGWMNADGTEPVTALFDKRYSNLGTGVAPSVVNQRGLFYRYEGAFKDTTDYRIATGIKQLGRRTGASDDGKYIVNNKHAALIGQAEPVVLVNKYFRTVDGKMQNIPLIRLAELYLNRAMARIKSGTPGWASDYNMIARRAWNATLAGSAYINKTDGEVTEHMILVERWKELAGEDSWYIPFCEAAGITIGQGDRTSNDATESISAPYANSYWSNCIPLAELDFQKK